MGNRKGTKEKAIGAVRDQATEEIGGQKRKEEQEVGSREKGPGPEEGT